MNHLNMMRVCDAIGLDRTGYGRERQFDAFEAMAIVLGWLLHVEQELPIPIAGGIAAKANPDAWQPVLAASLSGSDAIYWLAITGTRSRPDVRILDSDALGQLLMHDLPLEAMGGVVLQPLTRAVHSVLAALAQQKAPAARTAAVLRQFCCQPGVP
jgi:hypothetical protein